MPPFYTQVSVTSSDGGLYSSIQLAKAIYPHKNSVEYKFDNVAALKMNNIAMHYKIFPKSQVIAIEEYTNSIYNSNWEQSEVEGKQLVTPPQHHYKINNAKRTTFHLENGHKKLSQDDCGKRLCWNCLHVKGSILFK